MVTEWVKLTVYDTINNKNEIRKQVNHDIPSWAVKNNGNWFLKRIGKFGQILEVWLKKQRNTSPRPKHDPEPPYLVAFLSWHTMRSVLYTCPKNPGLPVYRFGTPATNRVILKNMFLFNCHDKVSKDLRASQFWPFCQEVLSEAKRKNWNCLRALARVFQTDTCNLTFWKAVGLWNSFFWRSFDDNSIT